MKKIVNKFFIIISFFTFFCFFSGNLIIAKETKSDDLSSNFDIEVAIQSLESTLSKMNTTASIEIEKQINKYKNLLDDLETDDENYEKIVNIIETYNDLLINHISNEKNELNRDINDRYDEAVFMVLGFFNAYGYNLAAELLNHAHSSSTILDSIYVPVNKDDVLQSSIYSNILSGSNYEGSSCFPQNGSVNDYDLYYAIYNFYYSKSISSSAVVIQDRYDYCSGDFNGTIGSIAIEAMYMAQELGYLTPYYVNISHSYDNSHLNASETVFIDSQDRIYEDKVTLGKGEYKDYYVTFQSGNVKIIQTTGIKDSYIYLYDSNDNLLSSNDDSGYNTNAFIRRFCSSNVTYKIRVKFFSNNEYGEIKLLITSSNGVVNDPLNTLNSYNNIYNFTSNNFTYNASSSEGYVKLVTFTPTERAKYIIQTEGNIDTYMYILDPRSSYLTSTLLDWFDDDDGDGNNAKIEVELTNDIPYLIVYSRYLVNLPSASFVLHTFKK